ncbi:MAG: dTDP-4-dehydrorhamnose 3,5-epimerase [Methanobrevibacter sp.]|nr:dTDP-4-dehydrorhamnose 3,5-epimerase [Candidatus Methanoflexus mossambicus]
MGKFKFNKTKIDGVQIIDPFFSEDERGFFLKSYHKGEFVENGIDVEFLEIFSSLSVKGVLRGLHFQNIQPQGKLIHVTKGEIFDVAVDLRKESKTYGEYVSVILSSDNKRHFYIPPEFAHGFLVLSDEAEVVYQLTDMYSSEGESGIIWNDTQIAIDWPLDDIGEENIILSQRDQNWNKLSETKTNF